MKDKEYNNSISTESLLNKYISEQTTFDKDSLTKAIEEYYMLYNLKKPLIYIFSSPFSMIYSLFIMTRLNKKLRAEYTSKKNVLKYCNKEEFLKKHLTGDGWAKFKWQLTSFLNEKLAEENYIYLKELLFNHINNTLYENLCTYNNENIFDLLNTGHHLTYSEILKTTTVKLKYEGVDLFEDDFASIRSAKLNEIFEQANSYNRILSNKVYSDIIASYIKLYTYYSLSISDCIFGFISFLEVIDYNIYSGKNNLQVINKLYIIYERIYKNCLTIIPFINMCFAYKKPLYIQKNSNNEINAEGKPAIVFEDGYNIWVYNNVVLHNPKYYCHPNNWQAKWLLEEKNAEVRRALIQALGTDRILSELDAREINSWREYKLYRLAESIDIEPFYILKMTCPSTGLVHAHRVPPDIQTARKAINWINHGIDAGSFIRES